MTDLTVLKAALSLVQSHKYCSNHTNEHLENTITALRDLITRMETPSSESLQTNSLLHLDDTNVVNIAPAMREQGLVEVDGIFKWLLGEEDEWPERQPGEGNFYWRKELRKRIAAMQPTPRGEVDEYKAVIWDTKGSCYWRPDGHGYTDKLEQAGHFSLRQIAERNETLSCRYLVPLPINTTKKQSAKPNGE